MTFRVLWPSLLVLCTACTTTGPATGPTSAPSPAEVFDRYVSAVHAADMPAVHALIGGVRDGRIVAFRFVPDFKDEATATFFGTLGIGPRANRN